MRDRIEVSPADARAGPLKVVTGRDNIRPKKRASPGSEDDHRAMVEKVVNILTGELTMPDPVTAGLIVALLTQNFSEALGKDLGEAAGSGLARFGSLVRSRLRGDPAAEQAVEALAAAPGDSARRDAALIAIQRRLDDDPQFRSDIARFVGASAGDPHFQRSIIQVGGEATVGKIVQIDRVTGDVSF